MMKRAGIWAILLSIGVSGALWADLESAMVFEPEEAPRGWVVGEYLLWWLKESPLPAPLVTSGSFAAGIPGALGEAGTRVLIGGQPMDTGANSGGRFVFGLWLDPEARFGVEGTYLFLPRSVTRQSAETSGQPGSPTLAVPFFDVTGVFGRGGVPGETVFILPTPFGATPGFQGRFDLGLASQLQGAEVNGAWRLSDSTPLWLSALAGFRWLQFEEDLTVSGLTSAAVGAPFAGFYNVFDRFQTRNNFWGGQLGARAVFDFEPLRLEALVKVALGSMHEDVNIGGSSQTSSGNLFFSTKGTAGQVLPGGIFTQPSNIGSYGHDAFAVVPEISTRISYRLTQAVQLSAGYSFLYVSTLVRPGDQIDRNINSTRTSLADASRATVGTGPGPIPFGKPGPAPAASGPAAPTFHFHESDFWAQGINIGVLVEF